MAESKYYLKELPEQAIYIGGKAFKFDVLETNDQWLQSELDSAIRQGIGGIISLTKEQFAEESKKKLNATQLLPSLQRQSEIRPQWSSGGGARPAVVLGSQQKPPNLPPAEPISIPSPKIFLPKVGKMSQ